MCPGRLTVTQEEALGQHQAIGRDRKYINEEITAQTVYLICPKSQSEQVMEIK